PRPGLHVDERRRRGVDRHRSRRPRARLLSAGALRRVSTRWHMRPASPRTGGGPVRGDASVRSPPAARRPPPAARRPPPAAGPPPGQPPVAYETSVAPDGWRARPGRRFCALAARRPPPAARRPPPAARRRPAAASRVPCEPESRVRHSINEFVTQTSSRRTHVE